MRKAAGLIGEQEDAARGDVKVDAVEKTLVGGREIIEQRELTAADPELENAVAECGCGHVHSIKRSVTCGDVHIAAGVGGQSCTAHPDAAQPPVWRRIEHSCLRKRRCIVGKYPAVIWESVAMRRVAEKERSVHKKQPWPVQLVKVAKGNLAPDTSVARSGNRGRDHRASGDVDRVQTMDEHAAFLRLRLDVHGSGYRVNDGGAGDSYLWNDVAAAGVQAAADRRRHDAGGGSMCRVNQVRLPQGARVRSRIVVCVERVHAVSFCGHKKHVVRAFARDRNVGQIQGLRVDISGHWLREELAEGTHGDVLGRENRFIRIRAAAGIVVMVRGHVHLRFRDGSCHHDC